MIKTDVISLTDAAADRVKHLVSISNEPVSGIRVGVRKGGCSGLTYKIDYAKEPVSGDEVIKINDDAEVYIDSAAVLYLLGTTMDFIEEKLSARFVFTNPNEKGNCGCGESFHV
ncbi:MAG: iron-sulfur cluster assembly accessory protein [Rickettsiales bacterium]|nr:iron-sulfur cluster assembly accessory protein [Rickettsiales bacterium]